MSLSHDAKNCLIKTLYVIKEHILYNSIDPDQTILLKVAWSGAQLLNTKEVLTLLCFS